jgi:DNA modification methylase
LADETVQVCVTSPPYWGLRDYKLGAAGIGLEKTPEEYVSNIVQVFREVRRVLRDDGTIWVNLGDSYSGGGRGNYDVVSENKGNGASRGLGRPTVPGLKPKDLVGIPWRVAFALQADGWYLRSDIIWHKPNPMPESVRDRPTKSHEYLFLLSKQPRYYYDAEAIAEPASPNTHMRISQDLANQVGSFRANGGNKTNGPMRAVVKGSTRKLAEAGSGIAANRDFESALAMKVENRNRRDVWTVPTQPYRGAHFATYPEKLVEPCILAGSKAGDVVLDPFCGSGTTGAVAVKHGRDFIGIDMSAEYLELARRRIGEAQVLLPLSPSDTSEPDSAASPRSVELCLGVRKLAEGEL